MDLKELQIASQAGPVARHPWEVARLGILVDWLRGYLAGPGVILDVGCGDGFVLSSVSQQFRRPGFGVDSAWEPGLAHLPPDVNVVTSLQRLPHLGHPAAILLMDVLEHLETPQDLLAELEERELLGPQTRVFVTVPAFQQLFSQHDRFLGHYRRYSRNELEQLMRQSGLEPLQTGYVFSSLLVVRWLQCQMERLGLADAKPSGVAEWKASPSLTGLIAGVLGLDAGLAQWLKAKFGVDLPGLSCYAICQPAR